ncbi:mechanosensitive ion channel protein MscS [Microtetraspora sp. NBRC 13810]|uniref:mechanosensitive ion channel family protein n=1 Tax=Microtetraspora sp. NBRC 13810 TaxID=3030990 RepID=UPI0024A4B41E|nr:mechanosensitive ion channel family protein [Microtetraspora sp. NBRC 13810]GLW10818.1 mechanosensitive ion channel protein MscS [Microtetraspora sp. NBRC 13810]
MFPLASPSPSPTPPPGIPDGSAMLSHLATTCENDQGFVCPLLNGLFPGSLDAWVPLIAGLTDLIVILALAFLLRGIGHRLISRIVNRAAETTLPLRKRRLEGVDLLLTERRKQRAETMGSVLKHVASIIVLGTAALTVLDRLGIPITPLLTSVGILGVAIGFGAQELVKDFIAGMFMLLEDQYGVGDVIDAGAAVGTVEAVTLRVTRLRDADGRVWYVRNGTITRIGNESQGWSRASIDVPVDYDADVPAVRELLKKVADELWEDPDYHGKVIVEEPQVFGLEQISDTAIIFRVAVKTIPAGQAEVARELRLRLKSALDRESIHIAASG